MPTGQSDGAIFSIEIFSSKMVLACIKLTKKKTPPAQWSSKIHSPFQNQNMLAWVHRDLWKWSIYLLMFVCPCVGVCMYISETGFFLKKPTEDTGCSPPSLSARFPHGKICYWTLLTSSGILLCLSLPALGLYDHAEKLRFHMDIGNLHSGPHFYTASH